MSVLNRLSRPLMAASLVLGVAASAHAMDSWYFNPAGTGFANATEFSGFNVGGYGFIDQSVSIQHLGFDFEEHGAYQIMMPSSGASPTAGFDITATYAVEGYVGLLGSGFTGGAISLYADPSFDFGSANGIFGADNGTLIAQFDVVGGAIDPLAGQASVAAQLVGASLASGYFFDAAGNDLAGVTGLGLTLGVQNQVIDPTGTRIVAELACEYGGFNGPGCNGAPYRPAFMDLAYSTVQDVGVATLTYNGGVPVVAVPEPASAVMMLTGLLGLFAWRRFRS
ncbi:PEP-CTERM sorting domain-containing protein [Nitrogeniibacter mangrovi]|uniref:PEP-CTERM sorting domain-containing protein n=1 Tax=Nitrogeniibacter mangrovi TaxID=2016596 RepID=A0A6C1B772_9RHOO|nr:PEP-CTERM sorting domain-containing protein [Nitrogeniibacter mangrovi]QID19616.1 PEP-CTERM sorting domain-containing protein [Nitrogeniibacter mangrovi]